MAYNNKMFFCISLIFSLCNNTYCMFTVKKNLPQQPKKYPYYSLAREALYEKRLEQKELTPLEAAYQKRLQEEEKTTPTKKHTSIPDLLVKNFIEKPESNTVYVAGSEGPSKDLVAIPLDIAQKIATLSNSMQALDVNYELIISMSQHPKKVIENVVQFLKEFGEKTKDIKDKKDKELVIRDLTTSMDLNTILECLFFMHNEDLVEENIIPTFIDIALQHLSKSNFDLLKSITILDTLESGNELTKEIIYNPLQEALRLLLIQKYTNPRKIVINGHSNGVKQVLCNNDGTIIASTGYSIGAISLYKTFCISDISSTHKPLVQEWVTSDNPTDIDCFDITKDGNKILLCLYKKSSSWLNPGLYVYYRNQNNKFVPKQLDGYKYRYTSARFNPSGTKVIITCLEDDWIKPPTLKLCDITNIKTPLLHPIQLSKKILSPNYDPLHNNIDFIDDTTIAALVEDNGKLKILFYNIESQQENSVELFDLQGGVNWDINKNNGTIAVYREIGHGTPHINIKLYILNNNDINNRKIFSIPTPPVPQNIYNNRPFVTNTIQFNADGSKIIEGHTFNGLGDEHRKRLYDFKKDQLSTISPKLRDAFNNIEIITGKDDCSIILQTIEPSLADGIAKYLSFKTDLSGLSKQVSQFGSALSLQFSKDGNSVIGSSNQNNNNLIVWPLTTKQDKKELEQVNKLPISIAKLLLPLSISSLQEKTTTVSLEDLNRIKIAVPQGIFNSLLIEPKLLSRSPEILATE